LIILYAKEIVFHYAIDQMNQPKHKLVICKVAFHSKLTSLIESLQLPNQASIYDVCAQSIICDQLKCNSNILTYLTFSSLFGLHNETKILYIIGEVAMFWSCTC
jgi:hypothetical protein